MGVCRGGKGRGRGMRSGKRVSRGGRVDEGRRVGVARGSERAHETEGEIRELETTGKGSRGTYSAVDGVQGLALAFRRRRGRTDGPRRGRCEGVRRRAGDLEEVLGRALDERCRCPRGRLLRADGSLCSFDIRAHLALALALLPLAVLDLLLELPPLVLPPLDAVEELGASLVVLRGERGDGRVEPGGLELHLVLADLHKPRLRPQPLELLLAFLALALLPHADLNALEQLARPPRRAEVHDLDQVLSSDLADPEQALAGALAKLGLKVVRDEGEELERLGDALEEDGVLGREGGVGDEFLGDDFDHGVVAGEGFADLGAPDVGRGPRGAGEGASLEEMADGGEEGCGGWGGSGWADGEGVFEGGGLEHGEAGGGEEGVEAGEGRGFVVLELRQRGLARGTELCKGGVKAPERRRPRRPWTCQS